MSLRECVDPHQLAVLEQALSKVCEIRGISAGTYEHETMASRVFLLYSAGVTSLEELVAGLTNQPESSE